MRGGDILNSEDAARYGAEVAEGDPPAFARIAMAQMRSIRSSISG